MDLKADLVRHYRWLREYGHNDSHSGNASVRDDDTVWVTPSGCCGDLLNASDLIRCPLDGEIPTGTSLDTPLHLASYRLNPKSRALFHSHGPYSVAMTLDGNNFTPVDFEGDYYFGEIPVITIPYDHYVEQAPAAVSETLASHRLTVVRGHGVYACGETINLAYKWTCSFELSAKTASIAQQAGTLGRK